MSGKLQAPTSKLQRNSKVQGPNRQSSEPLICADSQIMLKIRSKIKRGGWVAVGLTRRIHDLGSASISQSRYMSYSVTKAFCDPVRGSASKSAAALNRWPGPVQRGTLSPQWGEGRGEGWECPRRPIRIFDHRRLCSLLSPPTSCTLPAV